MISSNSNSINDIIICIDNSLVNLEKIKQDLSINNQQNNIIQFLTNLSYDLQNIINLLKCFNQKENMNNEKINNLQNQIYCFENELLYSNNKIRELNYLICDKECTIHELLNQKNNFCICNCNCPYCNSNMNNHDLSTKSTFYNKKTNTINLSYDCNNLMNSQNIPKKKNLSFDCGNDILEKTSNILKIKSNRNYVESLTNRNYSLTPNVQNNQKIEFNTAKLKDNLRFHNSYDNFNKINLNDDKNNNEIINNTLNNENNLNKDEKDLLNKDNKNKTNMKCFNKTKKDKNIKVENNKIIHDIIPKNNYSFNFKKMYFNKKTKSSSLPKEDINKINKKKKISPPKNNNLNTINTKKKPNQKVEYKFNLDEPESENNPIKPIPQSINNMNKNSFTNITKNINPNTIKKNYINDPNQLNNNLYINENQIEMNQELLNDKNNNLKDKINRIENIVQNALKDENTINKLKKKLGDNFIEKITKEDVTEDYLNKVENSINEINLEKGKNNNFIYNQYSNLKKNKINLTNKKSKDPIVNSLNNKQKLKKEITDNKYHFKEYPRSWISSKDYFVNNNNQNGKIEKSSLKIPNFP